MDSRDCGTYLQPPCLRLATEPFLLLHREHGTGCRRSWNCCDRRTRFVVIRKHFCFILSVLRSPAGYGLTLWCALGLLVGGGNASASVTVKVTVVVEILYRHICLPLVVWSRVVSLLRPSCSSAGDGGGGGVRCYAQSLYLPPATLAANRLMLSHVARSSCVVVIVVVCKISDESSTAGRDWMGVLHSPGPFL